MQSVADINVFDKAKSWQVIFRSSVIRKKENAGRRISVLEERVVTLQAEIQEKEAQLFKFQDDLDKSAGENEKLLIEQEKLLDEIATLNRGKDDSKSDFKEIVTRLSKCLQNLQHLSLRK